jgi:hypothetical protein
VKPRHWPEPNAYVEAVQNPSNLGDPELRAGQIEMKKNGLPRPYSGGFTTTFHVTAATRGFALRCFTRGNDDLEPRYTAITEFLRWVRNDAFSDAEYLDHGIRVDGQWWPVIKMQWVSGRQLNSEVEACLGNTAALTTLATSFRNVVRSLGVVGVAHGDLQHGNIIVGGGKLHLIDYDGTYLPALAGMQASELGLKDYQHPGRTTAFFDGRLDRFSSIVIYTALTALAADPSLWTRFNNDENMLFRADDYTSNGSSDLFQMLLRVPAAATFAQGLLAACRAPFEQVPTLDQVIQGAPAPGVGYSSFAPPPPKPRPAPGPKRPSQTRPAPQPIKWPPPTPQRPQQQQPQRQRPPTPQQPQVPQGTTRKPVITPVRILVAGGIAAWAFWHWPRPSSDAPPYSPPPPVVTVAPRPAQVLSPSGSCSAPNADDNREMWTAIEQFHRSVSSPKNWSEAAFYADPTSFTSVDAMKAGYSNTKESVPSFTSRNGCQVFVALRYQNFTGPHYCIDLRYDMEFTRGPPARWIIGKGHSVTSRREC